MLHVRAEINYNYEWLHDRSTWSSPKTYPVPREHQRVGGVECCVMTCGEGLGVGGVEEVVGGEVSRGVEEFSYVLFN